jgi:hypothetical protein
MPGRLTSHHSSAVSTPIERTMARLARFIRCRLSSFGRCLCRLLYTAAGVDVQVLCSHSWDHPPRSDAQIQAALGEIPISWGCIGLPLIAIQIAICTEANARAHAPRQRLRRTIEARHPAGQARPGGRSPGITVHSACAGCATLPRSRAEIGGRFPSRRRCRRRVMVRSGTPVGIAGGFQWVSTKRPRTPGCCLDVTFSAH